MVDSPLPDDADLLEALANSIQGPTGRYLTEREIADLLGYSDIRQVRRIRNREMRGEQPSKLHPAARKLIAYIYRHGEMTADAEEDSLLELAESFGKREA